MEMPSERLKLPIDSIGFGTNGISSQETLDLAIQKKYRLFDSADLYDNTEVLSKAMRESRISRQEFFINYKIFPSLEKNEFLQHVAAAIDAFTYVDCLMLHDTITDNPDDLEEVLKSLKPFLTSGKIHHLGISNVSYDQLEPLLNKFPEIKLVQNEFNHIQPDEEVRKLCKEKGVGYNSN